MKGAYRLGTYSGISVYLHWTFLAMMVGIFSFYLWNGASIVAALLSLSLVGLVFGCVILHEYGHALMARRFGVPTKDITMYPIGGVARLAHLPREPKQELFIALAGPAVNVVLGFFFLILAGSTQSISSLSTLSTSAIPSLMVYINFAMAAFNMIPAFPMDGGRVLRAGLATRMTFERATQIAGLVGMGIAVVFAIVGFVTVNVVLIFVGVFVYFGARQEIMQVVGTA